jgi:hypothetical protein
MVGILNAQHTSVVTRGDTTNMPEPECLFTGDDPLTEVSFEREEMGEAEENQGIWGPWTLVLTTLGKLM